MPLTTPGQKVERVRAIGGSLIEIVLVGDVFDDTEVEALARTAEDGSLYVHPFDDPQVIEGQGTVGKEILDDAPGTIDYVFVPVGGGGLASGVGSWIKTASPGTRIIGVEPKGAASMLKALKKGKVVTLDSIEAFTDGAAVRRVGNLTFNICRKVLDQMVTVPEGRICSMILTMYNDHGIIVEPAGALAVTALEDFRGQVRGKRVVCIVSGGNNDFRRIEEIRERALIYEGKKHYFIVRFPQRAGALRQFLNDVLGPDDDITHFEYSKKTDRERGPAVVGIEVSGPEAIEPVMERMKTLGFFGEYLNDRPDLMRYLV
jgi:threonine dehydratase